MRFRDLKSLLVNSIIRKISPLHRANEFLVDELPRNLGFGIALFLHHLQLQVAPYWFSQKLFLYLNGPMV